MEFSESNVTFFSVSLTTWETGKGSRVIFSGRVEARITVAIPKQALWLLSHRIFRKAALAHL